MAILEAFDLYRFFHTPESETLALRGVSLRLDEG
jgi:putative ABC transport system ATP-binding protein